MFSNGTKVRELTEQVEALEKEISPLRADRATLQNELRVGDAAEAVALVRRLEGEVEELRAAQMPAPAPEPEDDGSLGNLSDPKAVLSKIRTFTTKIESLNGTVASMEEQLMSLYEDKERLEREIGASEVDDVLEAFRGLQTTIGSMESQLMTMYAGRELLEVEIGKSDPRQIVAMVQSVAKLAEGLRNELGDEVFDKLSGDAEPGLPAYAGMDMK
jgi:chromosome segregation ATPase